MKMNNIQKSNLLNFAAGLMQGITFLLILIIYYKDFTTTQYLQIGAFIILNEGLIYVLMRMAHIITKKPIA